jgi:hypothetical protein
MGLVLELLHTRGPVGVLRVDRGDALDLKQVLDEVCECEALPRVGRRRTSKEGVGHAVRERRARRRRRELWNLVVSEVVGSGH